MTDRLVANVRKAIAKSLDQRRSLIEEVATKTAQITAHTTAAQAATSAGDAERAQSETAQADALRKTRAALHARMAAIDRSIVDQIGHRIQSVDPCDCEADIPLVLFPVRIETRYVAQGAILKVRIFPDDIHVDQLDRGLTD